MFVLNARRREVLLAGIAPPRVSLSSGGPAGSTAKGLQHFEQLLAIPLQGATTPWAPPQSA
eukprot:11603554-Alexandrium_andersonii.AAC.1